MSRIAGLSTRNNHTPRVRQLERMLTASRSSDRWKLVAAADGNAALGWMGWRNANHSSRDGVIAVVDGCFFNHPEHDRDRSDADHLIGLYQRYGFTAALERINGDFAVALYDLAEDRIWIGRDRIGVKPLYYVVKGDFFAFASRPRALLGLPGVSSDVNRQFVAAFAASHYRVIDNDPNASPYKDVAQLPAAHALCFKQGTLAKTQYWTLADQPDWTEPEEVLAERYRELLLDSVERRVGVAQRPAFTLSGGMDSSSVLASAVRVTGEKQHAVSTIYEDKTYDESRDIQTILDETVKQWHPIQLGTPDVFACVEKMVRVHDEPVATATWLSHFLLCEEVSRQGFGSLFGGLGGDELNAGEYEYFLFHFADLKRAKLERQLAHEIGKWIEYHDHPIYRKSAELVEREFGRLVDLSQPGLCLADRRRLEKYSAVLNPDVFEFREFHPAMDHPFASYLKNRTYQDMFRETAPCCLRAQDRQATAFDLDNFLPFFDHRLVEFMFRVPGHMKIRDGVTKVLLRAATRGVVPDETRTRIAKTGWNAPAHIWFTGAGYEQLRDLVHSRSFRERGIYNVPEVERLMDEHLKIVTGGQLRENHMMFFWQLVNLECWLASISSQLSSDSATLTEKRVA